MPDSGPTPPSTSSTRVASVDIIRGIVMILMAIDHVRVFAAVPASGITPALFFTRWVTHFCAPAFIFLAGTSAAFYGRKHGGLSRFLVTRGAWLIVLELTVLRFGWTFNLEFGEQMAGVIWVIGWCMILLAGIVKLPRPAIWVIGLIIVLGHSLLDYTIYDRIPEISASSLGWFWKVMYMGFWGGPFDMWPGGPSMIVLYSVVPWVAVMAFGYAFADVLRLPAERRRRICLAIGLGAIGLFLVLRGFNLYGDPRPWTMLVENPERPMPGLLAFLNTNKYPASLLFLLMTLGPTIAVIPLLERARGRVAERITVFGRVPFFYYILHIPLIHALALVVSALRLGEVSWWLFTNHPMGSPPAPEGYMWSLFLLYVVFAVTILILYFACRWFADFKAKNKERYWWLSYV